MLGTFDAAVDLPRFLAPAVALIVYGKLGSPDLLIVASSLPALVALPLALMIGEAKERQNAFRLRNGWASQATLAIA